MIGNLTISGGRREVPVRRDVQRASDERRVGAPPVAAAPPARLQRHVSRSRESSISLW